MHRFASLALKSRTDARIDSVNLEKLASIPKSGPEIKNRCTQEGVNRENLASIPKSGPEIKNQCTLEGVNRQNLASIRKSGLEIKNRCTLEGVNRQNPASILKSELEIKNRCTQEDLNGEKPASTLVRQWRRKRVLMRPEAAFPYVSAAESAQHPPNKPPRSTFRHAQRPAATTAAGETVLLCGNEDRQSKLRAQKK